MKRKEKKKNQQRTLDRLDGKNDDSSFFVVVNLINKTLNYFNAFEEKKLEMKRSFRLNKTKREHHNF